MTMVDEMLLRDALRAEADVFEASPEAMNRIIECARGVDVNKRRRIMPAFLRERGRGRTLLMAASFVLVVAGISLPLIRGDGGGPTNPFFRSLASNQSVQGAASSASSPSISSQTTALGAPTTSSSGVATSNQSLKIESRGTMQLTVRNGHVQESLTRLSTLALREGGFVDSTEAVASSPKSQNYTNGTIVLQVPQRHFATLVAQVQHFGTSTSVNVQSSDVSTQYVGLESRIAALNDSRRQYLTIMTRATSIGDILAVQAQLNSLQSQIEQLQGQKNLLDNEVTYGSLTVELSEASHAPSTSPPSGVSRAWHQSVAGFVAGFEWLIRIVGPALFVVMMCGALLWGSKFIRRTIRRRRITMWARDDDHGSSD